MQLRIKCKDCIDSVLSAEFLAQHIYCQFKEYDDFTSRLLYTTSTFATYVGKCLRFYLNTVPEIAYEVNLTATLCLKFNVSEQSKSNEVFGCPDHQRLFMTQLENFIVQSAMKWYGKSENAWFRQERRLLNKQKTKIHVIIVKQSTAAGYRKKAIKRAVKR